MTEFHYIQWIINESYHIIYPLHHIPHTQRIISRHMPNASYTQRIISRHMPNASYTQRIISHHMPNASYTQRIISHDMPNASYLDGRPKATRLRWLPQRTKARRVEGVNSEAEYWNRVKSSMVAIKDSSWRGIR